MDLTWPFLFPLGIVAALAIVQSMFGVGLLVFGTPTLLLAGFPFDRALALLLPASATISAAQLWQIRDRRLVQSSYLAWTVPCVAITLAVVLHYELRLDLKRLVGGLLLVTAMLRWSPPIQLALRAGLVRHQRAYLLAMGIVHGACNMGGGLLTLFATALHPTKEAARANIAAIYLAFASIQLTVLATLKPSVFDALCGCTPLMALVSYTIGNRLFRLSSPVSYQSMLSVIMLLYGTVLLF